jgi:hypothetical protein
MYAHYNTCLIKFRNTQRNTFYFINMYFPCLRRSSMQLSSFLERALFGVLISAMYAWALWWCMCARSDTYVRTFYTHIYTHTHTNTVTDGGGQPLDHCRWLAYGLRALVYFKLSFIVWRDKRQIYGEKNVHSQLLAKWCARILDFIWYLFHSIKRSRINTRWGSADLATCFLEVMLYRKVDHFVHIYAQALLCTCKSMHKLNGCFVFAFTDIWSNS